MKQSFTQLLLQILKEYCKADKIICLIIKFLKAGVSEAIDNTTPEALFLNADYLFVNNLNDCGKPVLRLLLTSFLLVLSKALKNLRMLPVALEVLPMLIDLSV
jgi:hypothetical protein